MTGPGHLDIVYGRRLLELRLIPEEVLRAEARAAAAQGSDLRGHLLRAGRITVAQDAQVRASFQGWTQPGALSASTQSALAPGGKPPPSGVANSLAASSASDPRTQARPSDPPKPGSGGPSSLLRQNSLPKAGGVFAGHTIEKELARGGMGAVFVATDPAGKPVALKVMLAGWKGGTQAERFKREAELGQRLDHPNVVRVLATGESDGQAWLTMELLVGARGLDAWCEEEGVSARGRLELVMALCAAIQHAHEQGAIHRDLKPANVLVVPGEGGQGAVRVVDFGLARLVDEERLTQSGATMGTLEYMAPEQVQGRTAHADARTDVWAIGAIIYELFTGKTPFAGETSIEVMRAILSLPTPPMGPLADDVPGLADVVRLALHKEPDGRYPSAVALGRDLAAVLSGTGSSDAAKKARQDRGRRLRRALATLAVAAVVVAGAAFAGRAALAARARQERAGRAGRATAALVEALDVKGSLEVEEALARRLREMVDDGADTPELAATARRVEAFGALVALARGDAAAAASAHAALPPSDAPERLALRGGLAAYDDAADARAAAADLDQAWKGGVTRPEVRGWRGLALARLAEGGVDAARALADLDVLGAARPLRGPERAWRIRLLVRAGRLDDAATTAGEAPPELRWPLGLHLAATRLGSGDLPAACVAAEALGEGPPPDEHRAAAALLCKRLMAHVDPLARQLQPAVQVEPAIWQPVVRALHLVRRLEPGRSLEPTLGHLLQVACGVVSRGDADLAFALPALAPDDRELQTTVALFGDRQRSNLQKERFMPVLRRAIELTEDRDVRNELDARLVAMLGAVGKAEECLSRSERLLPLLRDEDHVISLHTARGQALRALGRHDAALRALDEVFEIKQDVRASYERAVTLRAMGREDDLLAEAKRYIRMTGDPGCVEHDLMALLLWRIGRPRPAERPHVRHAVDRVLEGRAQYGQWWLRSALLRLEDGQLDLARSDLSRAVEHLGAGGEDERAWAASTREAAQRLERGDAAAALADVRALVEAVDARSGA